MDEMIFHLMTFMSYVAFMHWSMIALVVVYHYIDFCNSLII